MSYTVEHDRVVHRCMRRSLESSHSYTAQPSVEIDDYPTIKTPSQNPEVPPTDLPPATALAGQSLHRSSRPHESPEHYGVTVRH